MNQMQTWKVTAYNNSNFYMFSCYTLPAKHFQSLNLLLQFIAFCPVIRERFEKVFRKKVVSYL